MSSPTTIITALRQRRIDRGLSQQDVADRIGASQSQISGYERGAQAPGLLVLIDWAGALDCDVALRGRPT